MRTMSRRRSRTAVLAHTEIGIALGRARRNLAFFDLGDVRRDIEHRPVPEPDSRRRVRIPNGQGEALCPRRRAAPFHMWGHVIAAGAHAVEDVAFWDRLVVAERAALNLKLLCHGLS